MLSIIVLSWSLANCCPAVHSLRAQGYTDNQIEQMAREYHVPEWVIKFARRHCVKN